VKILLDTHLLVWMVGYPRQLPTDARLAIENPANEVLFSAISIWEIAIKTSLGKPDFAVDPRLLRRKLLTNGYSELPLLSDHAVAVLHLPAIHKDLFDRILVAQATVEGITLLTSDATIAKYPGPVQRV
jgi:PIN domain nuclease of toxin-antitoxin system